MKLYTYLRKKLNFTFIKIEHIYNNWGIKYLINSKVKFRTRKKEFVRL